MESGPQLIFNLIARFYTAMTAVTHTYSCSDFVQITN